MSYQTKQKWQFPQTVLTPLHLSEMLAKIEQIPTCDEKKSFMYKAIALNTFLSLVYLPIDFQMSNIIQWGQVT